MSATAIKNMTTKQLIDSCVWLEREQKESKRVLNAYKAELQVRAAAAMADKNIRYVKFYGDVGTAAFMDGLSIDINNIDKLKDILGEGVFKTKVEEKVKIDYKLNPKLEKAVKAALTDNYSLESLEDFLDEMRVKPDEKQKKLLLKKLKGEYEKDKQTLISVLGFAEAEQNLDFDVELWCICQIKNGELIKAFLPEEGLHLTLKKLRECISFETKTAITIDYDEEGKDGDNNE